VCAGTEVHIAASKGAQLGVAQTRLHCHLQEGPVTTPEPRSRVWRGEKSLGLRLREELERRTLVPLVRDRQNLLALKRADRLCVGDESEERAHGGKAGVASLRCAGTLVLEVLEERADECRVELFHAELRRRSRQARRREDEQQPERVAVGRDGMGTRAKLRF
jgi:hypothetical protein